MPETIQTGTGLLFPLLREHDDFASGEGVTLLKSNVRKAIGIRAASRDGKYSGEYAWRGNFGSQIDRLRHSNLDSGTHDDLARIYATDAVALWEPRARVSTERTVVNRSLSGRANRISVKFVPNTGQVDNLVGLEESAEVQIG